MYMYVLYMRGLSLSWPQGYRTNQIRIWPFEKRNNHTTRPSYVDRADDPNKTVIQWYCIMLIEMVTVRTSCVCV